MTTARLVRPSTCAHLAALFGRLPDGAHVGLWSAVDKLTRWATPNQLHTLAVAGAELDRAGHDVFVLVNPRTSGLPAHRRGKGEEVTGLVGVWADVDLALPGHAAPASGLPLPTAEQAQTVLDAYAPPPTFWLSTGGGWHWYWLLTTAWMFDGEACRTDAENLSARWHGHLAEAFRRARLHFDTTPDLTRHLRLAGTHRRKGGTCLPVVLDDGDDTWPDFGVFDTEDQLRRDWRPDRTYTVAELEAVAKLRFAKPPPSRPPAPPRGATAGAPFGAGDGDTPADVVKATYTWADLFGRAGWEHVGTNGETELWKRPGATSAYSARAWANTCTVWSSAAGLPHGPGMRLSKFRTLAHLRFDGDERAAARAVGDWCRNGGTKP